MSIFCHDKEVFHSASIVLNLTNWNQLLPRVSNFSKLLSSNYQWNLIFTLIRAHLHFLRWDLDDNRMKIFVNRTPWNSMGNPWEKNCTNEKNFDLQKLKQTLYLHWGMLIFTSYVEIFSGKNFSFGFNCSQLSQLSIDWNQLLPRVYNW
jgi:hypothetical protein